MTAKTMTLYRRWRSLAEKGYGTHTSITDMLKIDQRIRRAKEAYELARRQEAQH